MKKKDFLFSLVAVLIIGLIVSSATFAYFQWSSGVADRTSVNVTIASGQITMNIDPGDTTYMGLRPTNNCNNSDVFCRFSPLIHAQLFYPYYRFPLNVQFGRIHQLV